jgi:hypothetical protein
MCSGTMCSGTMWHTFLWYCESVLRSICLWSEIIVSEDNPLFDRNNQLNIPSFLGLVMLLNLELWVNVVVTKKRYLLLEQLWRLPKNRLLSSWLIVLIFFIWNQNTLFVNHCRKDLLTYLDMVWISINWNLFHILKCVFVMLNF